MNDQNLSDRLQLVRAALAAGNLPSAIEAAQSLVAAHPQFADAHRLLGEAWRRSSQLEDAERAFRSAVACAPENSEGWNSLGVVLSMQHNLPGALEAFRESVRLKPDSAAVQTNLAMALLQSRNPREAVANFSRAVELNPASEAAWTGWVRSLQESQQHEEAVRVGRQLIARHPQSVDAHQRLGASLEATGELEQAQLAFEEALRLNPQGYRSLFGLARVAERQNRLLDALRHGTKALAIVPHDGGLNFFVGALKLRICLTHSEMQLPLPELRRLAQEAVDHLTIASNQLGTAAAYSSLGNAYRNIEDDESAERAHLRSLEKQPHWQEPMLALGLIALERGDKPRAQQWLRRALSQHSDCAAAWYHLAINGFLEAEPACQSRLKELAADPARSPAEHIHLQFALARVLEKSGDLAGAFAAYQEANACKSRQRPLHRKRFDPAAEEMITASKSVFTSEYFAQRAGWGHETRRPIFVVGLPRSGTTLTEQILASHPDVVGAGELGDLVCLAQELCWNEPHGKHYPQAMESVSPQAVWKVASEYDAELRRRGGPARFVVDKMPGNYVLLGLIALCFPNCRVINVRRDPRDIAISCFRSNLEWPFCDLQATARLTIRHAALMDHWHKVLPIPVHEVQYETLVADLEAESKKLLAFCGLDWNDRCLRFHETERAVRTPSKSQVRSPVYQSSVGFWRRYEPYLTEVNAILDRANPG